MRSLHQVLVIFGPPAKTGIAGHMVYDGLLVELYVTKKTLRFFTYSLEFISAIADLWAKSDIVRYYFGPGPN